MTVTPEQINAAWALVNAATEGPWSWNKPRRGWMVGFYHGDDVVCDFGVDELHNNSCGCPPLDADAAFIAASRELVPQLLTALEAERANVARLVGTVERSMRALKRQWRLNRKRHSHAGVSGLLECKVSASSRPRRPHRNQGDRP